MPLAARLRHINRRGLVRASHPAARIGAALEVARVRISTEVPVARVILCELLKLVARQIGLVDRLACFLDLMLVQKRASNARQSRLLQEPLACELMHGHAVLCR